MKKLLNGVLLDMTSEEVADYEKSIKVHPCPTSEPEALAAFARMQLKPVLAAMQVNEILSVEPLIDAWGPGAYSIGDVRTYAGQIWRCCQIHDSTVNADVIPGSAPAHWVAYHSTDPQHAKLFVPPAGAHDMYRAGEWMIYNERLYKCRSDTAHSPEEFPDAWTKR